MADDLKPLLDSTEGEGPSPEFVDRLRKQLASEGAWSSVVADDEVTDLTPVSRDLSSGFDDKSRSGKSAPWPYLIVAAAAVVLLVGIGVLVRPNDSEQGVDSVATRPDTPPPPTAQPAPTATTEVVATPNVLESGVLINDNFAFLETGTYVSNALGTPLGFELHESFLLRHNSAGRMRLSAPDTGDVSGDRTITLNRLSVFSDPTMPTVEWQSLEDGWPANDFGGWLDNLVDTVTVSDRQATTVGGYDAIRVELRLAEIECENPVPCAFLGTNRRADAVGLLKSATSQVWLIDQSPHDPIVISAVDDDPDDSSWFDIADDFVDSIVFGDPAPNPVQGYGPGDVELPVLGGVSATIQQPLAVFTHHVGFERAVLGSEDTRIDFIVTPLNTDDEPLDSSNALVETLRRAGLELIAREPIVIDGVRADSFDLEGTVTWPVLRLTPQATEGWFAGESSIGRLWTLEHPDRGLLMIAAIGAGASDADTADAVAFVHDLLADLTFIEFD